MSESILFTASLKATMWEYQNTDFINEMDGTISNLCSMPSLLLQI